MESKQYSKDNEFEYWILLKHFFSRILNNVSSIELDFICDNSDDEIADLPLVKYILPKNI